ncbi:hypothetical protein HYT55_05970 [Candidatus Woesearchaeota archaeon]|nr:hypothetical protein [Candidatus Woesearchaeota archaeon]
MSIQLFERWRKQVIVPSKEPNESSQQQGIEDTLKRLSSSKLPRIINSSHEGIYSFGEWLQYARDLSDPNQVRTAIYGLFQPLYDALIRREFVDSTLPDAVAVLDGIISEGIKFLTDFYLGEPNVASFKESVQALEPKISTFARETSYRTKARNIGANAIYPEDIKQFLQNYLERTLDGKQQTDFIIGCACGSSEVVMPLAGMLNVDLGFMRRSWRRGDSEPRIVEAHADFLRGSSQRKTVLCVEDYVCSGGSLSAVMRKAQNYDAANVYGASVRSTFRSEGMGNLRETVGQTGFHLFEFDNAR